MEKYWFLCHNIVSLMLEESYFFCGWFPLLHVSFNPTKLYGTFTMRVVLFSLFASLSASYSSNMILKVRIWLLLPCIFCFYLHQHRVHVHMPCPLIFPWEPYHQLRMFLFYRLAIGKWSQMSWVAVTPGEPVMFFRDFFLMCMGTYTFSSHQLPVMSA